MAPAPSRGVERGIDLAPGMRRWRVRGHGMRPSLSKQALLHVPYPLGTAGGHLARTLELRSGKVSS